MKSIYFLVPAVFFTVAVLNGPLAAGPLEDACRVAVRVQQHGPECTQVTVPLNGPSHDACGMNDKIQMQYMEKVIDCVNRGGPVRAGIVGNTQKRASARF